MADFGMWIALLVRHYQNWIGGGGSGGVAVLILFFIERFGGWTMANQWYILLFFVAFILGSSFVVWQKEHHELIALKKKLEAPEFGGEISAVATGQQNGYPLVTIGGIITNPLGPPSGVIGFQMIIEFPDGRMFIGQPPLPTGKDITVPLDGAEQSIILKASEYWPDKGTNPISSGGSLPGWLWSVFVGLDLNEAYQKNALLIVEFADVVASEKHRLTTHFTSTGIHLPLGNMPPK